MLNAIIEQQNLGDESLRSESVPVEEMKSGEYETDSQNEGD